GLDEHDPPAARADVRLGGGHERARRAAAVVRGVDGDPVEVEGRLGERRAAVAGVTDDAGGRDLEDANDGVVVGLEERRVDELARGLGLFRAEGPGRLEDRADARPVSGPGRMYRTIPTHSRGVPWRAG